MHRTESDGSPETGPQRSMGRNASALVLLAVSVVAIAVGGVTSAHSSARQAADAAPVTVGSAAGRVAPPGVRPDVQSWFKSRDKALVELNNALVPIVQGRLSSPGAGSPECRRVDAAIKALEARGHAPHAEVDRLARAGEDKLVEAASACLSGDLTTTQQLVAQAMSERAAASLPLEDALEGE
jgi:hypothetical protein